jgi:hypothetical protein
MTVTLIIGSVAAWWAFLWFVGRWLFNRSNTQTIIDRRLADSVSHCSKPTKLPLDLMPAAGTRLPANRFIKDTHVIPFRSKELA